MIGKGRLHVGLPHFIKKKKIGGKIKKDLKFLANMPIDIDGEEKIHLPKGKPSERLGRKAAGLSPGLPG